jgi:hypothetical protein
MKLIYQREKTKKKKTGQIIKLNRLYLICTNKINKKFFETHTRKFSNGFPRYRKNIEFLPTILYRFEEKNSEDEKKIKITTP